MQFLHFDWRIEGRALDIKINGNGSTYLFFGIRSEF